MTEKTAMKELRRRGVDLKPNIHVGKEGLTDGLVEELAKQIKTHKLVKVRVLPSADTDISELGEELCQRTGGVLVDARGSVILISNKRTHQQLRDKKA